jgi:hypothetical protein
MAARAHIEPRLSFNPLHWIWLVCDLFCRRKFVAHRFFGAAYLIQFFYICILFVQDYDAFLLSNVIITFPITGVLQTATAMYYFRFLPKKKVDSGYFNQTAVMSYPFVVENLFFALLLCFQWLYYNDRIHPYIAGTPIEPLFVFLPYTWRHLFPKTSFRDAINGREKGNDATHQRFYWWATWITKIFYIWAKHYIGFFLNYLRLFDYVTPHIQYGVYMILIPASFATTVAMFLHTLRFKGYLPAIISFTIYAVSYMLTFYSYYHIASVFIDHFWLTAWVAAGMVLNVFDLNLWHAWQVYFAFVYYVKFLVV